MYSISVTVNHCSVRIENERNKVAAAYIYQITVNIGKQVCFLGNEYGLFSTFYSPTDKCGHLTAFSHACLVTDDKCLALLHLINGHCHAVNLFCGKGLMSFIYRIIAKFFSDKFIYAPMLFFDL